MQFFLFFFEHTERRRFKRGNSIQRNYHSEEQAPSFSIQMSRIFSQKTVNRHPFKRIFFAIYSCSDEEGRKTGGWRSTLPEQSPHCRSIHRPILSRSLFPTMKRGNWKTFPAFPVCAETRRNVGQGRNKLISTTKKNDAT